MVENAGEVNRVLAAQENEMRSQMVAAATAMAGVDINGSFAATMAARSAFVGDPADKIKVAAWEAAQKLADGLGGDRRKDPSGAMADAGMVALNALKHNKGPDGNPLNEYQENMVSSAVGSANMAAGGGMVPAAAARSSGVNGIDGDRYNLAPGEEIRNDPRLNHNWGPDSLRRPGLPPGVFERPPVLRDPPVAVGIDPHPPWGNGGGKIVVGGDVAIDAPYQPLPRHEPPVAGIGDHHYSGPPRGKPAELSAEQLAELNKAMQEMVADQQIAEIQNLFRDNGPSLTDRQPSTLPHFAQKPRGHEMA